jgi:stress response protein SCP2
MDIQISVQNPQKAIALLEFLKSFEMIDKFKILGNSFVKVEPENTETLLELENDENKKIIVKNRFNKYNGIWKNKQSIEQIDEQLNAMRSEWERTF